ncbi:hypothetical protein OGH69_03785 [Flavobacterium sp. MFBS3-15]|uniref:hypothetical protein n=1 Tax=Flavobacterium sp. MFBS3-15 TaxID=2989816 RepID=UPI00223688DE|nr:hypothetical protein [Flavobacterium sp. MFBS3-15]MCW4468076.1 hypothetical protein [Flavobacterium sp. MFBS3-15]
MGLFKKKKGTKDYSAERLFKDAVKEINELYDDVRSDYSEVESVMEDFSKFIEEMKSRLDTKDAEKLEDFSIRFKKMATCAKNTVRDLRDVSRNHKKRLAEIKRERE